MVYLNGYLFIEKNKKHNSLFNYFQLREEEHLVKDFLTGIVASKPRIKIDEKRRHTIEVLVNVEGFESKHPVSFYNKNFCLDSNMVNLLKELEKTRTCVNLHHDHVEVEGIKFKGMTCSWAVSHVKEQYLEQVLAHLNNLPKQKFR